MLMEGVRRIGGPVVAPPDIFGDTLALVHDRRYIQFLTTLWERWQRVPGAAETPTPNVFALGRASLPPVGYPESVVGQCGWHLGDGSCPITPRTWEAARASAATAAHGAKLVLEGERLAYALCRPPGHHAAADMAAGFCYLNNSALAAALFTQAGKRAAVLDIDVHHGNGTEAIFYDRADVLTISIHAHPKRFYPFFWGYAEERGRGHYLASQMPAFGGSEGLRPPTFVREYAQVVCGHRCGAASRRSLEAWCVLCMRFGCSCTSLHVTSYLRISTIAIG